MASQPSINQSEGVIPIIGHKYLISVDLKAGADVSNLSEAHTIHIRLGGTDAIGSFYLGSDWATYTKITNAETTDRFWIWFYNSAKNQEVVYDWYMRNVMIFDLTLLCGSGKEPSTFEDFQTWLTQNVGYKEYYAYFKPANFRNLPVNRVQKYPKALSRHPRFMPCFSLAGGQEPFLQRTITSKIR